MHVFRPRVLAIALLAVLLAGCTVQGSGDIGLPVQRSLMWFSYLNGDDIRQSCVAGAPDRARLIYNGRYTEQVRTYDLSAQGDGGLLAGRVFSGPSVLTMGDGTGLGLSRGRPWDRGLSPDVAGRLWAALERAGAFAPSPRLTLESREVWWLAVGCRGGQVFFHAWEAGRAGFPHAVFRPVLEVLDPTGIAFAPVKPAINPLARQAAEDEQLYGFQVEAAPGGLLYQ